MKYLIKDINKNEKEELEKKGLYCYDLRESDTGDEIANIEKNVFVNKVGNMITNEKIEFGKNSNDFVNYLEFCMKNKQVDKIEDLFEMKKLDVNKAIKEVTELLKNNENYEDMEICYILEDMKDKNKSIVIAMNDDKIIQINPITKEIMDRADWEYNVDDDVFGMLEDNKKIVYMSMMMHFNMWESIKDYYPEDIEYKNGTQKYLKYCKENKITKEVIEKATKFDDVYDAMKHYKKDRIKGKDDR